ncbi:hypothetical protein ACV35H_34490, partial [Pseudomonas aeruginosa]
MERHHASGNCVSGHFTEFVSALDDEHNTALRIKPRPRHRHPVGDSTQRLPLDRARGVVFIIASGNEFGE